MPALWDTLIFIYLEFDIKYNIFETLGGGAKETWKICKEQAFRTCLQQKSLWQYDR
jgi:hypothetical protein